MPDPHRFGGGPREGPDRRRIGAAHGPAGLVVSRIGIIFPVADHSEASQRSIGTHMPKTLFKLMIPEGRGTLPVFLSLRLSDDWAEPRPWTFGNESLPYVGWRVTRRENGRLLTLLLGPLQLLAAAPPAPKEASGPGTIRPGI